jgi:hypothetical protein
MIIRFGTMKCWKIFDDPSLAVDGLPQRYCDFAGDVVLNFQDIVQRAIIGFGPDHESIVGGGTRRPGILLSRSMSSSVIPSAKYSWSIDSLVRSRNGSTAIEVRVGGAFGAVLWCTVPNLP